MKNKKENNEDILKEVNDEQYEKDENQLLENDEDVKALEKGNDKKEETNTNNNKSIAIPFIVSFILILLVVLYMTPKWGDGDTSKGESFSIISVESKSKGKFIDNNETFIIKTKGATLEEVQKHIFIEPALDYKIEEKNSNEYHVVVDNIPSDTLVNIDYVNNEVVDYKWAFQSTKELGVTSIYPTDNARAVGTNSLIEVNLSYSDVEDLDKHFEINPKVEGSFEHLGKTWRFTPKKELAKDTKYEIVITEGYTNGTFVAEKSYSSSFTTSDYYDYGVSYSSITIDEINTFLPDEKPIFYSNTDKTFKSVSISKFKDYNEFLKYLNGKTKYEIEEVKDNYTLTPIYTNCFQLNTNLKEGYYLEKVTTNDNYEMLIPVQVNSLSAYSLVTSDDLLVWVASGDKLLSDIKVTYGKEEVKTDKDGIATIKNYNVNKDDNIKYIYVGDKDPLIIGVVETSRKEYNSAYVYTDRPIYKNKDVINYWGFVPIKYMDLDMDVKDIKIKHGDDVIIDGINKDGTFKGKIELNNVKDDDYNYECITANYKNESLGVRCFDIENYQKQNYEYDVDYKSNVLNVGEKFDFDITVKHVTGMVVSNKEVVISYRDKTYTEKTNEQGIAHFSITPEFSSSNYTFYSSEYVYVKNSLSEMSDYSKSITFFIVDKKIDIEDYEYDSKKKKINFKINNIDSNRKEKVDYSNISSKLNDGPYNGPATVKIIETVTTRHVTGEYINQYTKEKEYYYSYSNNLNTIDEKTVDVKDGVLDYNVSYERQVSTDDVSYSYKVVLSIKDDNGKDSIREVYLYDDTSEEADKYRRGYVADYSESMPYIGDGANYNTYRYYLDILDKQYSVNDVIDLILKDYNKKDIIEKAKFLEIKFKNRIIDTKLYNNTEDVTNNFTSKDVPGMNITAALLLDGHFYRLPDRYYDFNEKDKELNISIETDKDTYAPGDEVKLSIQTKDKDNKKIKTKVLVSVVDEKIFKLVEDYTNILGTIYTDNSYYSYTYSSYRDYEIFFNGGGKGGTGGDGRANFGDTVFFDEVETDDSGNAILSFKLNDSVTSFRITVHAVNEDDYVGANKTNITSTLPLAIEFVEPRGLKETDDVVVSATSVGDTKEKIEYEFEIKGVDKKISKSSVIGGTVFANFGKLGVGTYDVTISAKAKGESDKVKYSLQVGTTQQEITKKQTFNIKKTKNIEVKKNPIYLEFYRESMKEYIKYVDILKNTNQERLDVLLGYQKGVEYYNKYYDDDIVIYPFEIMDYKVDYTYLKYLKNEDKSEVLTALASYYVPDIYKISRYSIDNLYSNNVDLENEIKKNLLLASIKEPVLDDLDYIKDKYSKELDEEYKLYLALSYIFVGDYDKAKELYVDETDELKGLKALISTFINKDKAKDMIDSVYSKDEADRYIYFAIMSYLENNSVDLSKKETVLVKYNGKSEKIELNGLNIQKLRISESDLKNLEFDSKYNDIMVDYSYEGVLSDDDNYVEDINISLSNNNLSLSNVVDLNVDLSKLKGVSGSVKIFLPNSLRMNGRIESKEGIYLRDNNIDYLSLYIFEKHDNKISIPLYVSSPGKYKMDYIVLKENDKYHISNTLDINVDE